jgi:hypothetical protein
VTVDTERHFLSLEIRPLAVGEQWTARVQVPSELGAFQLLELQCSDPQALQVWAATWGPAADHPPAALITGAPCPLELMVGRARLPILEAGALATFSLRNPAVWPYGCIPLVTRPTELVLGGTAWRPAQWRRTQEAP